MKKIIYILLLIFPYISLANTVPNISGKNAVAIETSSGRILYEKNAFDRANIASTTKIMTAIVAVENNSLTDTVVISKKAASTAGSSVDLKENDEIKLSELLYGLMLNSGNDAAVAIAEHTAGNVEEFAKLMNEKAKEIGALNTNFVTPHGLDMDGHYSTAYDMAIISRYALNNPTISKLVSTQYHTMTFLNGKTKQLKNTNPLLYFYNGISGMKTGYTGLAGKCLVASAKREDLEIIVVTLGEPSSQLRINNTVKILDYCFNNYKMYDLKELYKINFSINIKKSPKTSRFRGNLFSYSIRLKLSLAELRSATSCFETVFLTFFHTWITCKESSSLKYWSVFCICLKKGSCNTMSDGSSLSCVSATFNVNKNIKFAICLCCNKRLTNDNLQSL